MKVRCPACWGDLELDEKGLLPWHKEQILGARGFVDGYANCKAGGRQPRLIDRQPQELEGTPE